MNLLRKFLTIHFFYVLLNSTFFKKGWILGKKYLASQVGKGGV